MTLRAIFAFRCLFLSDEKLCTIHPAVVGGEDTRPSHCGYMGTPNAIYGEKGFCRIIRAGKDGDKASVNEAIDLETRSSEAYFNKGVTSLTKSR